MTKHDPIEDAVVCVKKEANYKKFHKCINIVGICIGLAAVSCIIAVFLITKSSQITADYFSLGLVVVCSGLMLLAVIIDTEFKRMTEGSRARRNANRFAEHLNSLCSLLGVHTLQGFELIMKEGDLKATAEHLLKSGIRGQFALEQFLKRVKDYTNLDPGGCFYFIPERIRSHREELVALQQALYPYGLLDMGGLRLYMDRVREEMRQEALKREELAKRSSTSEA